MIFITLGTQKFQFDRLLKEVDNLVVKGIINDKVFAQIGYSEYKPKSFEYKAFLDNDIFNKLMDESSLVITHGGTGSIVSALKRRKKVIAVPRLKKFGEHVDDHQIQIIQEFIEKNYILGCTSIEDLGKVYLKSKKGVFKPYVSNSDVFIKDIEFFLNGCDNI